MTPSLMTNGTTNVRIASTQLYQVTPDQPFFGGSIIYPLITGTEGVFGQLYANMAKDFDLGEWTITYGIDKRIKYVLREIEHVSIQINQSEAISIEASVICEKVVADKAAGAKIVSVGDFLKPARLYTWNDATANIYQGGKIVVPSNSVRAASMTFVRVAGGVRVSGTVIQMGESDHVFDQDQNIEVEIGYGLHTSSILRTQDSIRVGDVRVKEEPGYDEGTSVFTEVVNGVEVQREVRSDLLCTRFDWESVKVHT